MFLQIIHPSRVQAKWFKNCCTRITALISKKINSRKNEKKRRICLKSWLKRRKKTLLAELWLEYEYDYNILIRMISENFEKISQLIKGDITKENTKMRELIPPPNYKLQSRLAFYQHENYTYVYDYYSFFSTMSSSTFTSFRAFVFSRFFMSSPFILDFSLN